MRYFRFLAGLFMALMVAACTPQPASNPGQSAPAGSEGASVSAGGSHEKVFHLYAADVMQELAPGKTLYSWGFGLWDEKNNRPATKPTVPGPELRVTEGDHVKVVFHNKQKEPHTIHFHGIDNSFAGDGMPGVSQEEVKTDETFTYEFDATKPGTYFYHCHVEPDRHPEMGLYGAFIVEPKQPKTAYDGEFVLMLAERDPHLSLAEGTEAGEFVGTAAEHLHQDGDYDTANRHPEFFTINGKMDDEIKPLKVKKGGTYLIRLINAGNDVHTIHIHGHHFQVIASDGRDLPQPEIKDSVTLGPGERYDLVLTADNPGVWPLHCHIGPHGTHGMHTFVVYEGYEDKLMHHAHHGFDKVLEDYASAKEYLFDKKYPQAKVEMEEVAQYFDKVKGTVAASKPAVAKEIETAIQKMLAELNGKHDAKVLKSLSDKLDDLFNQAQQEE